MTSNEFQKLLKSGHFSYKNGKLISKGEKKKSPLSQKSKKSKIEKSEEPKKKTTRFTTKRYLQILEEQKKLVIQLEGEYHFDIRPVPKPRMTQRDRWAERPVVVRYFNYVDDIKAKAELMGLTTLPYRIKSIKYIMPIPKTWPKKEVPAMINQPHLQKPDIDNLRKALQDAICKEDSHISYIGHEEKVWGKEGKIIIII